MSRTVVFEPETNHIHYEIEYLNKYDVWEQTSGTWYGGEIVVKNKYFSQDDATAIAYQLAERGIKVRTVRVEDE